MEKPVTVTGSEPEVPEQVPSVPRAWAPLDGDRAERWASCAAPGARVQFTKCSQRAALRNSLHRRQERRRPWLLPEPRAPGAGGASLPGHGRAGSGRVCLGPVQGELSCLGCCSHAEPRARPGPGGACATGWARAPAPSPGTGLGGRGRDYNSHGAAGRNGPCRPP